MTHEEIMSHSRRFINALYKQYIQRACENLGVSPNAKDSDELTEEDYPEDFGEMPGSWHNQPQIEIANNDDFMAMFNDMGMDKYNTSKMLFDE